MKKNSILILILLIALSIKAQCNSDSLRIYLNDFQFNKAILWLDRQENSRENQLQKAMCYKALGENRKATFVLEALAKEFPKDIQIKKELAQCYEEAQKWRSSAYAYAELIDLDSVNVYFAIKKAESEINYKDIASAKSGLIDILASDTLTSTLRLLAKSYELSNNLDTAAYYYNMGWEKDSMDVFFAANFVNTCLKKKETLAAYASCQKYIDKDTTNSQMNFLYGYCFYSMENYEKSRDILQKCFLAGDSSLVVNRTLGMSHYFMGDSENSYKYLSMAYQQDTTNNTVLHHLAVSANDIKKYDEAVNYFSKMLYRLIPSKMQLYLNYRGLAIAYEKSEKYFEAAQCYEKAIENATQDQTFYLLEPLAHLYYEHLERKPDALYYYKQYRTTLDGMLLNMKYTTDGQDYREDIKKTSKQIEELDKFISQINREIQETIAASSKQAQEKKTHARTESSILYIVNGKIVELPPTDFRKLISTKTIHQLEKAAGEELVYVDIAKEKGKRTIIIFEIEEENKANEGIAKDTIAMSAD